MPGALLVFNLTGNTFRKFLLEITLEILLSEIVVILKGTDNNFARSFNRSGSPIIVRS